MSDKKNYSVELTYTVSVYVEGAEDEDEAISLAVDEVPFSTGVDYDSFVFMVEDKDIELYKRHADYISEDC